MVKTCDCHARFFIFVVIMMKGNCIQGRNQGDDAESAEEIK